MIQLVWDCGTAYDLFVSLQAMHHPGRYGLRGTWSRGIRARLSADHRELLEQAIQALGLLGPIRWVHTLPELKDGAAVLRALEQISPAKRLPSLAFHLDLQPDIPSILTGVLERGVWDERDLRAIGRIVPKKKFDETALSWWAKSQEFGERYLEALRSYYEVFFAEEEQRIRPALEEGLARAKELATDLELPDLLEELSQGLRLAELPPVAELVLAPSFWSTPLIVQVRVEAERELILFGARPSDASLVPGEVVPDALVRALKALADPTRLRILRYLTAEPLSPTQLARRLRLRAPTVVHHLDALRMAGLVYLTLEAGEKRRYAARLEAARSAFAILEAFLAGDEKN